MNNPYIPRKDLLFEPTHDQYGDRLALVFGNHATGGLCPYAKHDSCIHCDIGLGEGTRFTESMNLARLDWFKTYYSDTLSRIGHLLIYNSGSVLNQGEIPLSVLEKILDFSLTLPRLRLISLESRESFVKQRVLHKIASHLGKGREFRIILGLESVNNVIRNVILKKKMSLENLRSAGHVISQVFNMTKLDKTNLATPSLAMNIIVGGPGTTPDSTVSDALQSAMFSLQFAENYGIPLGLNLHPYYPSSKSMFYYPNHSRPSIRIICETVITIVEHIQNRATVYVGWYDENHDQEPQKRARETEEIYQELLYFNKTGFIDRLKSLTYAP